MINLTAISEKEKLIDSYIERCDNVKTDAEASKLQDEIIGVFGNEIPHINASLDRGSYDFLGTYVPIDHCNNIRVLRAKLVNYKINVKQGGTFVNVVSTDGTNKEHPSLVVYNDNKPKVEVSVSITLEQTLSAINQLPDTVLSADDKKNLYDNLIQVASEKEPDSRWDKAKETIKWILEKGLDVTIAALPYIVEALKK